MVRKRSLSSVLDDNPITTNPRISVRTIVQPRRARKVRCNCSNCKGILVDPRTKTQHELQELVDELSEEVSADTSSPHIDEISEVLENTGIQENYSSEVLENPRIQENVIGEPSQLTALNEQRVDEVQLLPRKRELRYTSARISIINLGQNTTEGDQNDGNSDDDESNGDNESENNNSEFFEDYSCPSFEPFREPNIAQTYNEFSWILLWIMKFRMRFNIPETATESLLKFMKLVLEEVGVTIENFPDTLYKARNFLGLEDRFHSFVVCTKCHKLYNKQEVKEFRQDGALAVMKCRHIEFPNSSRRRMCQTPLSHQTKLLNEVSNQYEMIYPFSTIRQQLAMLYLQPEFEKLLRHWVNRPHSDNIITDIYDGQVWKTFKETSGDNSPNFFRSEVADSNIGLMLNVDWFQPYEGTTHSTGVIYAAICNLPREIRFKRENLLILGILPGPHEVSLHKINHYLSPIVDDLTSLWDGLTLKTFEAQEGKKIRAALVLVSCDVPAARKICGHVSALVSCHRCKKRANYENRQNNFAGMDNINEWFVNRESAEFRENAHEWRHCESDASRKRFTKDTGARWSELLRLPYFDPIRFIIVDPMHCLFLGIARWIVKRIWIDEGILSQESLIEIQKKMDEFQVPSDLGRIPGKIHCGEGFSNFTADQWRIFFSIYATVSLWSHLSVHDRKILNYFVRICTIFVSRILELDAVRESHERLIEIVKLIEEHYGRDKITPNLHLSLHLSECTHDFGPLYAFWCFSFERMNGVLGALPNSHRKIEPEIMRRMMNDSYINSIINSAGGEVKGLELLKQRPLVGSLAESDEFSSDEMERFWLNSRNIQQSTTTGSEPFPGEMMGPVSKNVVMTSSMLDLLVEYYMATYETLEFRKPFGEGSEDSRIISVKMKQFGRCRIGSETFGSNMSARHVKNSYVLAKFITQDGSVDCYPGQVQFFFSHKVDLPDGELEHNLAFIRWYQPANSRYYFSIEDDEICNVELWGTEFYPEGRDCIIPVHNILSRFVPIKYKISDRKNAREYLAVNPVNRKFNIR